MQTCVACMHVAASERVLTLFLSLARARSLCVHLLLGQSHRHSAADAAADGSDAPAQPSSLPVRATRAEECSQDVAVIQENCRVLGQFSTLYRTKKVVVICKKFDSSYPASTCAINILPSLYELAFVQTFKKFATIINTYFIKGNKNDF